MVVCIDGKVPTMRLVAYAAQFGIKMLISRPGGAARYEFYRDDHSIGYAIGRTQAQLWLKGFAEGVKAGTEAKEAYERTE